MPHKFTVNNDDTMVVINEYSMMERLGGVKLFPLHTEDSGNERRKEPSEEL